MNSNAKSAKKSQPRQRGTASTLTALKPLLSPHDSRAIRDRSSAYASFQSASGNAVAGVHEVNLSMVDFLDIDSNGAWVSIGYDVTSLPGVFDSSSVRLRHCHVSVLEGSMLDGVVDASVGVLAGIRVSEGGFVNEPRLVSASQTLVLPSSVPRWRTVLEAPLAQLAEQGFLGGFLTGNTEVARLGLIDPDTGALLDGVSAQVKVELSYSASFPLTSVAQVHVVTVADVLAAPVGDAVPTAVFPRVTGTSNRV